MGLVAATQSNRIEIGPGKLWLAPLGTITSAYAPISSGNVFTLGSTSNDVPGNAAWIPIGASKSGGEFDVTLTTADVTVEELYDPVKVVPTARKTGFKFEMAQINTTNWAIAVNNATSAWNGTPSATGVAFMDPPAVGSETRYQLLFCNNDQDFVLVLWQVLQIGSLAEKFQKGANYSTLLADWNAEIPPVAVAPQPWRIYVTGSDWGATVNTE